MSAQFVLVCAKWSSPAGSSMSELAYVLWQHKKKEGENSTASGCHKGCFLYQLHLLSWQKNELVLH